MNTNLADQDCPAEELIGGKIVAMSPATTKGALIYVYVLQA